MPGVPQSELAGFVDPPRFEEYSEKYKEHVAMERRDGVIMLRMHTQNKPVVWSAQSHRAIPQRAYQVIRRVLEREQVAAV